MPRVDLAGVSDLHVHLAPCLFDRIADDVEMAEHSIISSDTGSPRKPCPPENTRDYRYSLGVLGISYAELRSMSAESPRRLLEVRR